MLAVIFLACGVASAAPQSLSAWLSSHHDIETALYWEGAHASYPRWSAADKAFLESEYRIAQTAIANPRASAFELPDPLPNQKVLGDKDDAKTVYAPDLARREFFASVALSLALETSHRLPWSMTALKQEELAILLDSREFFHFDAAENGYVVDENQVGLASPGDPGRVFRFLVEQKILGANAHQTIVNFVAWSSRLHHDVVSPKALSEHWKRESAAFQSAFWDFRGFMPVTRVLDGTRQTMLTSDQSLTHWTAGCWGTTGLFRDVLRVANIPVKVGQADGHAFPIFLSDKSFLSHGDDPYNASFTRLAPPAPYGELVIPMSKWADYFSKEKNRIGSRPYEVAEAHH